MRDRYYRSMKARLCDRSLNIVTVKAAVLTFIYEALLQTYVTAVRPLGNVQSNTRLPVPNQMANTVIVLRLAGKTRFLCTPTAISKLL